jgi:hypothetical protein
MHSPVAVVAQEARVGDSGFGTQATAGVWPLVPLLQVPMQDDPPAMLEHVAGQGWELVTMGVVGRPAQSAGHTRQAQHCWSRPYITY